LGIRWDRLGRFALLAVLCGILALYVSPILQWRAQTATADAQRQAVAELKAEHARLERGVAALRSPSALDEQARRLGMVKKGEVPLVVDGLPGASPKDEPHEGPPAPAPRAPATAPSTP
jgi:cell division protein FtsB